MEGVPVNGAINVFKINGTTALFIFFAVTAMFGAAHLAALSAPNTKLAKAWLVLGF